MAKRYNDKKDMPNSDDEKMKNILVNDEDETMKNIIVIDEDEEADQLEKDWSIMAEEDGITLKFEEYNGSKYYVEDNEDEHHEKLWGLHDYDGDDEDDDYY